MDDFLEGCLKDHQSKTGHKTPAREFKSVFCARCRNPTCQNAGWGKDLFAKRVAQQVSRLFDAEQADPTLSKYQGITGARWETVGRSDWDVAEIPVTDGVIEVTSPSSVDEALRAMARSQGRPDPFLPVADAEPRVNDPEPESPAVTPASEPTQPQNEGTPLPRVPNPARVKPGKVESRPVPQGGVMIGGGPPPAQKAPPKDPWAPPEGAQIKKVKTGARVRMGGGDE